MQVLDPFFLFDKDYLSISLMNSCEVISGDFINRVCSAKISTINIRMTIVETKKWLDYLKVAV